LQFIFSCDILIETGDIMPSKKITTYTIFGEWLYELCQNHKIQITEVADNCSLGYFAMRYIMTGKTKLQWEIMVQVCSYLAEKTGIPERELLFVLINTLQGWKG